jgi:MFS family permease
VTAAPAKARRARLLGADRNFTLLWAGEAVSSLGSTASLLAYPLLVLATTRSAADVGLVMALALSARLAVALPGGTLVDRLDKRHLMLTCDLVRAAAQAGLVAVLAAHDSGIPLIIVAAVIDNAFSSVFGAAEPTAVRLFVPAAQLPLALARIEARDAGALLIGPLIGGLLFAVAPWLPFLFNCLSYIASFACLTLIHPPAPAPATGGQPGYRLIFSGLRWIWNQPFLRVTLLLISGNNFVSNAALILAIVIARQHGSSAAATGLLLTLASTGSLSGALLAPRLVQRLPVRTILIANRCLWAALIPQFAWVHNVYALGAILAVMLLMGPAGSTAVITSQMAITPEDMQGRASSARGFCTGLAAPAGTALIGYALVQLGLTASVLALTTSLVLMAAIASTSPSLRAKTSRAVAPACTNVP